MRNLTGLKDLYASRKEDFQGNMDRLKRKMNWVSWLRVFVAIAIFGFAYASFGNPVWCFFLMGAVVSFLFLVSRYEGLKYDRKLYENLVLINEAEQAGLQGNYHFFADGAEFLDVSHPYSYDLDVVGSGSLFQRFNRTCTEPGKKRLAQMLLNPLRSADDVVERQQAIAEVNDRIDFRQRFHAIGMMAPENDADQQQLLDWLKLPHMVYGKKIYTAALGIAPFMAFASILYAVIAGLYGPLIISALLQWTIIGLHSKRTLLFQEYIGNKRSLLSKFASHFRLLQSQSFTSSAWLRIKESSARAEEQMQILSSRSRALDLRLNFLVNILLNSTMLYDLFCIRRLEQWREKNREHLEQWLKAVRDADALNSFGNFMFNHPHFTVPQITATGGLKAASLGHPLLGHQQMVCNSVEMHEGANVWIVTGANMAGKSTFLRTVGINTVLALSGSVVCAKSMSCPVVQIYTGMRNNDSINDNQSYFFSELLRLQHIIEQLRSGHRMLVLLDEILKGTNSADKLTGSQALVHQLVNYPCFMIIATHDVVLGEMEQQYPEVIKNYHFETFIQGNELSFDYLLKPGISTGKNATFLMKKMGIIE